MTRSTSTSPLQDGWNYRVELPDVVTRTRYARALTGTRLLEIANRGNHDAGHSAELPPWLTDGLALQLLGSEPAKIILSSPSKTGHRLAQSHVNSKEQRPRSPDRRAPDLAGCSRAYF